MNQNAMEMIIQIEDKAEIERLLSMLNVGLCVALEQGALSIEAAKYYLYSPYTLEMLQKLDVSPKLLQVLHLGTELEDVESLLPEKLIDKPSKDRTIIGASPCGRPLLDGLSISKAQKRFANRRQVDPWVWQQKPASATAPGSCKVFLCST